jgi:cation:H+ antiporter
VIPAGAFLLVAGVELTVYAPETALWAAPAILLAAMMIAWAAEAAQFYISQGFALAILAWLQTLPEFAVEAVLAWHRQVPYLMAGLTGALRLLTGLGWPMIYFVAAFMHRRRNGTPLREIRLEGEHAVEVMGLAAPLAYMIFVWWKGRLELYDAAVLVALYAAYLWVLAKIPPQDAEKAEDLEGIPRLVVFSPRPLRVLYIVLLFVGGGALIKYTAAPFLGSLFSLSAMLGIPTFVFIQWVAPFVSEFPEKVSAFNWARTVTRAPMALMNMVSSNINQWTLLVAMLVIVFSVSAGRPSEIPFDEQQSLELLMTIGQSLVGMIFLLNMQLAWWEAAALFGLWAFQFALSPVKPGPELWRQLAGHAHYWVTVAYLVWFGIEVVRTLASWRKPVAVVEMGRMWRLHVRRTLKAG